MSQMSDYLENEFLDHILRVGSFTMPAGSYLALYLSNPADDNSGSEISGNGYARQSTTWAVASAGSSSNSSQETFTASGGNWGTVTHWAVFDAVSAGNMLFYASLDVARIINNGDSLVFEIGDLTVTAS